ncbi:winged helix-turn-helix domain-containing protein [Pseudoalteromonas luteoviolacea]|uniref:OmpR/PhoB-type domain-containing protein n=1 Tax=Pseudoalteromonas luteoviolacea DSM 6061 TaxID=1365250 RepID=A0A166UVJ1_9GAMM|nr:winged helix-turn-helix domain-containing protein [Pseudoalteromonas luteoviolacea]KZN30859.1 hypothetical protein N475_23865 [Pseudoalteromonas luteoviolacea DSM 6061]MBE0386226.1 hypothetical protein [Pseudoalteromonas luteoviolacea DSM 6061]
MTNHDVFSLGPYIVHVNENQITCLDENYPAPPKVVNVLRYLAEQHPKVVSRDELIEQIWDGNQAVGEKALTNTIWQVRQFFNHPNAEIEVIETIRKRGYKLNVTPQPVGIEKPLVQSDYTNKSLVFPLIVVASIISGVMFSLQKKVTQQDITSGVTSITKMPGSELRPVPSPDGKLLAFTSNAGGDRQLYVKTLGDENVPLQQVTFADKSPFKAVWSSDQSALYFAQKNAVSCEIVKLSLNTKEISKLANCPVKSGYNYIAISNDGKTLAFHGQEKGDSSDGIYFLDLTQQNAKPIRFSCDVNCQYRDRDMAFSPDGKTLAVTQRKSKALERIALYTLNRQELKILSQEHSDIVGLSWHPSGDYLAYGEQTADKRTGFIVNVASEQKYKIDIAGFSYPSFSNDGGIFFQTRRENYFVASYQLGDEVAISPQPLIESHFANQSAVYSKEQNKLAFLSNESGYYELWLSDQDGFNRTQLTHLNKKLRYPTWSADGTKLLVVSVAENKEDDQIYIYNLKNQGLTKLDLRLGVVGRPIWHPNNKDLVIKQKVDGRSNLFKLDINSFELTQLTHKGAYIGNFIDPQTLIYSYGDTLWKQDLREANKRERLLSKNEFNNNYSWTRYEDKIFFKSEGQGFYTIKSYDFFSKTVTPFVRIPQEQATDSDALSYNSKKHQLILTMRLTPQSDIKYYVPELER